MKPKPFVAIGFMGTQKDMGDSKNPLGGFRPSVFLCRQDDWPLARFEFIFQPAFEKEARAVMDDMRRAGSHTEVRGHLMPFKDPYDFEEVFAALHDFARGYPFDPDREDYLVHISTGTHAMQIGLFLLTESRHIPARLAQTEPPPQGTPKSAGRLRLIDLDLARYDRIAQRFRKEQREAHDFLKSGIQTRNPAFNALIERVEEVALASSEPILLTGPTGAGKSRLAHRIFELKKSRRLLGGGFVEVNCATLRGDTAMSALFGHVKGAFTGATHDRPGLLRQADRGMLFLDEIGDLGVEEQAMLLRALEDKTFLPLGADKEAHSDFQLIAGTNRELQADVEAGRFREDLLARINLWSFRMPALRERLEDLNPNLEYELDQYAARAGARVTFNKEARERFVAFASSPEALWRRNFRDLNGAIKRMATLAPGGRITEAVVEEELGRLRREWTTRSEAPGENLVERLLGKEAAERLDRFERVQLEEVLRVCREKESLAEAGRILFAQSRLNKKQPNDSDRLRKYLAGFGLSWDEVKKRKPFS